ncbi:MAG: metallopeptidase family protein [Chitinophagales bacterium]
MLTFDEFTQIVEENVDLIPEKFCRGLNGGFNVLRESKGDGQFWTMAEYVERGWLGKFILFYYGSFRAVLGNSPVETWKKEVLDTIFHELQHHLESLAGRDDLARKELQELAEILNGRF